MPRSTDEERERLPKGPAAPSPSDEPPTLYPSPELARSAVDAGVVPPQQVLLPRYIPLPDQLYHLRHRFPAVLHSVLLECTRCHQWVPVEVLPHIPEEVGVALATSQEAADRVQQQLGDRAQQNARAREEAKRSTLEWHSPRLRASLEASSSTAAVEKGEPNSTKEGRETRGSRKPATDDASASPSTEQQLLRTLREFIAVAHADHAGSSGTSLSAVASATAIPGTTGANAAPPSRYYIPNPANFVCTWQECEKADLLLDVRQRWLGELYHALGQQSGATDSRTGSKNGPPAAPSEEANDDIRGGRKRHTEHETAASRSVKAVEVPAPIVNTGGRTASPRPGVNAFSPTSSMHLSNDVADSGLAALGAALREHRDALNERLSRELDVRRSERLLQSNSASRGGGAGGGGVGSRPGSPAEEDDPPPFHTATTAGSTGSQSAAPSAAVAATPLSPHDTPPGAAVDTVVPTGGANKGRDHDDSEEGERRYRLQHSWVQAAVQHLLRDDDAVLSAFCWVVCERCGKTRRVAQPFPGGGAPFICALSSTAGSCAVPEEEAIVRYTCDYAENELRHMALSSPLLPYPLKQQYERLLQATAYCAADASSVVSATTAFSTTPPPPPSVPALVEEPLLRLLRTDTAKRFYAAASPTGQSSASSVGGGRGRSGSSAAVTGGDRSTATSGPVVSNGTPLVTPASLPLLRQLSLAMRKRSLGAFARQLLLTPGEIRLKREDVLRHSILQSGEGSAGAAPSQPSDHSTLPPETVHVHAPESTPPPPPRPPPAQPALAEVKQEPVSRDSSEPGEEREWGDGTRRPRRVRRIVPPPFIGKDERSTGRGGRTRSLRNVPHGHDRAGTPPTNTAVVAVPEVVADATSRSSVTVTAAGGARADVEGLKRRRRRAASHVNVDGTPSALAMGEGGRRRREAEREEGRKGRVTKTKPEEENEEENEEEEEVGTRRRRRRTDAVVASSTSELSQTTARPRRRAARVEGEADAARPPTTSSSPVAEAPVTRKRGRPPKSAQLEVASMAPRQEPSSSTRDGGKASAALRSAHVVQTQRVPVENKDGNAKKSEEEEDVIHWVQCDRCAKWRVIPQQLPQSVTYWECRMRGDGTTCADMDDEERMQQEGKPH